MTLASKGVIPDKYWVTEPDRQYYRIKFTVAMSLLENGKIAPKYCYHDIKIRNYKGQTMAMMYAYKGLIPDK